MQELKTQLDKFGFKSKNTKRTKSTKRTKHKQIINFWKHKIVENGFKHSNNVDEYTKGL